MIRGTIPPTVAHGEAYWSWRNIFLDCTGPLIIEPDTHFGWNVHIYTRKHPINQLTYEPESMDAPVIVRRGAQVYSDVVLSECEIGEHAIVCAGAVVIGKNVEPRTMVAGNPPKVIKRWDGERWASV